MEKIYLGRIRDDIDNSNLKGDRLRIEHHSWDCGWYWGFGYIGNVMLHTHADVFIKDFLWYSPEELFTESIFHSEHDFWIFKDFLKQAYTLKEAAEVYLYGGHCVNFKSAGVDITSEMKNQEINRDLKKVLDAMWFFLKECKEKGIKNYDENRCSTCGTLLS